MLKYKNIFLNGIYNLIFLFIKYIIDLTILLLYIICPEGIKYVMPFFISEFQIIQE